MKKCPSQDLSCFLEELDSTIFLMNSVDKFCGILLKTTSVALEGGEFSGANFLIDSGFVGLWFE